VAGLTALNPGGRPEHQMPIAFSKWFLIYLSALSNLGGLRAAL